MTFNVKNSTGTWANAQDALVANSNGYLAAADMYEVRGTRGRPNNAAASATGL